MFGSLMLVFGSMLMMYSVKLFLKEFYLIKHGVKKVAKLVELDSFSYITHDTENNKLYNFGINPVLELDMGSKKIRVDYHSYDDMSDLKEGDEVEVIYPEDNVAAMTRYSRFGLFKDSIIIGIVAIISIILAVSVIVL